MDGSPRALVGRSRPSRGRAGWTGVVDTLTSRHRGPRKVDDALSWRPEYAGTQGARVAKYEPHI